MTPMTRWTSPQPEPYPPSSPLSKLGILIIFGSKRRRWRRGLVNINTHYYIHLDTQLGGNDHETVPNPHSHVQWNWPHVSTRPDEHFCFQYSSMFGHFCKLNWLSYWSFNNWTYPSGLIEETPKACHRWMCPLFSFCICYPTQVSSYFSFLTRKLGERQLKTLD